MVAVSLGFYSILGRPIFFGRFWISPVFLGFFFWMYGFGYDFEVVFLMDFGGRLLASRGTVLGSLQALAIPCCSPASLWHLGSTLTHSSHCRDGGRCSYRVSKQAGTVTTSTRNRNSSAGILVGRASHPKCAKMFCWTPACKMRAQPWASNTSGVVFGLHHGQCHGH